MIKANKSRMLNTSKTLIVVDYKTYDVTKRPMARVI